MTGQPEKFDAGKVADRARQIVELEKEIVTLRRAKEAADHALGSAECRLSNLQMEFTRAVERHVNPSLIRSPRRMEVS